MIEARIFGRIGNLKEGMLERRGRFVIRSTGQRSVLNGRNGRDMLILIDSDTFGIETRKIWTTAELSAYINFPRRGQAFLIQRQVIDKKTGRHSVDTVYGISSRTPAKASPQRISQATGAPDHRE